MKGDFGGELRRRMEEAAILPSDHPIRGEVRASVSEAGEWAQREWLALQQENERLHLRLQEVTAPPGLEERLHSIPRGAQRKSRAWKSIAAVAAVLLLMASIVATVLIRSGAGSLDRSLAHVASLVAYDHSTHPQLTVIASDPRRAIESIQRSAPFPVRLTTIPGGPGAATLVGGRICRFDEGPLIYTRWNSARGDISMYQLRIGDFGLPANLPAREVTWDQPDRDLDRHLDRHKGRCRVRLWSDERFAYAIVADDEPANADS